MKQTAVEWLEDNLIFQPWAEEHFKHNLECWDKAKQMEKEQIVVAHGSKLKNSKGATNYEYWYTGEMYYNETFKSE
jgi:hypothetical protein